MTELPKLSGWLFMLFFALIFLCAISRVGPTSANVRVHGCERDENNREGANIVFLVDMPTHRLILYTLKTDWLKQPMNW